MEKDPFRITMEQSRVQNQFQCHTVVPGNEELLSVSREVMRDPTSSISTNTRPPEQHKPGVQPVHNYSIQTGEEFALEFMRDRFNLRKPFTPNTISDPTYATGYLELKGILGISHTGSESGSDISMVNMVEKGAKEFERRNSSLHDDRSNHGPVLLVPRTSSGYEYPSSGASESSTTKMKVLCSFGGKILPRLNDRKLRYVGGETHIIRLRKDISWQELKQKTLAIYIEAHVIKYQLPGEDLDALVSVSCDEDLQNMLEEWNELGDREGSQKLRMFLFSMSDLEDNQFGLGSSGADSDIQYVVAVNGMDLGSRTGSTLHGLASASENNLNELDRRKVERETSGVTSGLFGLSILPMTGVAVSSTIQSSEPILSSDPIASEIFPHLHDGRDIRETEIRQYPLHFHHDSYNYSHFGEIPASVPLHGLMNRQIGLNEAQPYGIFPIQTPQVLAEEVKPSDVSFQGEIHPEKSHPLEKDYPVPSQPYGGKVTPSFPIEDAVVANAAIERNLPSLPSKNEGKHQDPAKISSSFGDIKPVHLPKSRKNDECPISSAAAGPDYANSASKPNELSNLEPSLPPPRVYYSEIIPREQADLLSRFSKSDDSLGSQFLVSHTNSDVVQQVSVIDSARDIHTNNLTAFTGDGVSTAKPSFVEPHTMDNGLVKLQRYKEFADPISQMDSKLSDSEGVSKDVLNQAALKVVDGKDSATTNRTLKSDHNNTTCATNNHKHEAGEPESYNPVFGQVTSVVCHDDPASSQFDWGETTAKITTATEQGDILIDIEDRFPRDVLFDIFSKAISDGSSDVNPLPNDGAGLSLNVENHEPKHWSYFRNLAQDGIPASHVDSPVSFGEDYQKNLPENVGTNSAVPISEFDHPQLEVHDSTQFEAMIENLKTLDSEYEDGKKGTKNMGLQPLGPSVEEFDIDTLQVIQNEDLEELKELGSGSFGTVYHGKWRGTDVAIKRIKKICFTGRSSEQERLAIEFWREADILSKLHHPNVVAFYGVVQDGPGGTLATVAEYMVDGSLRHVLLRKDRYLDRRKRLLIAMDAAFGMEYLHSKNIVHFDLKCDNLLVNLKDPLRPICKVGDFGLSKIKRNTLVSGGVRGTLPWMAPELLNGSSNKVSEKVDVFSFGIVLWEILTGEEPYSNMHYGAIIGGIVNNTLRPTIPSFCDPEWRRLMEQCWTPNPVARPSFTEIAGHLREMSRAASQSKTHGNKAPK
ncbi:probable serine/threonine-protein kinase DDB_G0267686 isoform X2 [Tripterygium wilfordii]|uniref:probable serine/threonine-protein kinase DDB_G0267686 isoform X2 n=1 Tax=Tripterygium wilfordii TaxID=458696 RepID=UPI0018F8249E|nr:probable serine/threonine-protein kinase DDB_G0267686 isoform X2 [Tripterygium wilfordii]